MSSFRIKKLFQKSCDGKIPCMADIDPESWEAVGARLERIRDALGLNKTQIAEAIGISNSQWTNYIKGDNLIPLHVAIRLCKLAGVTTDYIYRDTIRSVVDPEMAAKLAPLAKPRVKRA
jgi:transcriptional regulator with XRE-family HTH domain